MPDPLVEESKPPTEPKPVTATIRVPLSDRQFASETELTNFLNDREQNFRELITGLWYDYADETTKKPLGNVYEYRPLAWGENPPTQQLTLVKVTGAWDDFAQQHAGDFQFVAHALMVFGADQVTEIALLRAVENPLPAIPPYEPSAEAKPLVNTILGLAQNSAIAAHHWLNQGLAPVGYTKGMALAFARVYAKLKAGDAAAKAMTDANSRGTDRDALAIFNQQLSAAGMGSPQNEAEQLRRLFTILMGLAMPESSGRYWIGLDANAPGNANAEECEAGLFQTSWNARNSVNNPAITSLMLGLFTQYKASPQNGMVEVFKEGVFKDGRERSSPNWGTGEGALFQKLSKACPAFAAEFTALGLRHVRKHWGTIRDGKVEIQAKCDQLFQAVQDAVDQAAPVAI